MANDINYNEQYDVFLSYRRDGGETMAILLRDRLAAKGYRVFLDVEGLRSGDFNERLLRVIEGCTDFIVVLSQNSLDRCANKGDWVRREIAHALEKEKNVVPFFLRGFDWPDALPGDIASLPKQNGVNARDNEYFDAAVDRLADQFLLSKPYTKKRKPLSDKARKILMYVTMLVATLVALAVVVPALAKHWENTKERYFEGEDGSSASEQTTGGDNGSNPTTTTGATTNGDAIIQSSSFSELLSRVKENDECVVYYQEDPPLFSFVETVNRYYTLCLFYPTGILSYARGMMMNVNEKHEAIEGLIQFTNNYEDGFPKPEQKGAYTKGSYTVAVDGVEFTVFPDNENGFGKFNDDGSIHITSDAEYATTGDFFPQGVFMNGKLLPLE